MSEKISDRVTLESKLAWERARLATIEGIIAANNPKEQEIKDRIKTVGAIRENIARLDALLQDPAA